MRSPTLLLLPVLAVALAAAPAAAQQRPRDTARTPAPDTIAPPLTTARVVPAGPGVHALSLAEALRIAEGRSETVRIAQAGVLRARGQQYQARSQLLPQIYGSGSYTRTLRSQFQGLGGTATTPPPPQYGPDTVPHNLCSYYNLPPNPTTAEQQAALAALTACQAQSGLDFSRLPFGRVNQYSLGLSGSQTLFAGGRIASQIQASAAGARAATIELASQRAQLQLDVTQAYYDAVLGERLLAVAESSLVQAEQVYQQTRLARQVGNTSEFDLLRAQVTRDNQRPVVIQNRMQRNLALLRLKQLLDLPLSDSLALTTDIIDSTLPPPRIASTDSAPPSVRPAAARAAASELLAIDTTAQAAVAPEDTSTDARAPVRQAAQAVRAQRAQLRVAHAERLPTVTLSTQYGRVAYPNGGLPSWSDFLTNWTVSLGVNVPIFTGGRILGDEMVARAGLLEARARYDQVRELAALDARSAVDQLREAEASWMASQGTTEQAARAYQIAAVRYREGISTQLELAQSRLLYEQAAVNRAYAARNLKVARARVALLRDLPLGGSTGAAAGAAAGTTNGMGGAAGGASPQTQTQQPNQPSAAAAQASAGGFTGTTGTTGGMTP